MGVAGMFVLIGSIIGIVGNLQDMGPHYCSTPQADPVCGTYPWFIGELAFIALLGGAMMVAGLYLASRTGKSTT